MFFFFFNDPAPPEIYPLSLHDALPISRSPRTPRTGRDRSRSAVRPRLAHRAGSHALEPQLGARRVHHRRRRSEEHTSELQSLAYLVCRLLLEKKKSHKLAAEILPQEKL